MYYELHHGVDKGLTICYQDYWKWGINWLYCWIDLDEEPNIVGIKLPSADNYKQQMLEDILL